MAKLICKLLVAIAVAASCGSARSDPTCATIPCTGAADTHRYIAGNTACASSTCTEVECCETKATCGNKDGASGAAISDADCGSGYTYHPARANNVCAGTTCVVGTSGSTDQASCCINAKLVWDCVNRIKPLQVLKDLTDAAYLIKELNVFNGQYSSLYSIAMAGSEIFGAYLAMNSCAINPIDGVLYCVIQKSYTGCTTAALADTVKCKYFVVRMGLDSATPVNFVGEYVAHMVGYTNAAEFDSDGTFWFRQAHSFDADPAGALPQPRPSTGLARLANLAALPGYPATISNNDDTDAAVDNILANVYDATRGIFHSNQNAGADLGLHVSNLLGVSPSQNQKYLFSGITANQIYSFPIQAGECTIRSPVDDSNLPANGLDCTGRCASGYTCCTFDSSTGRPLKYPRCASDTNGGCDGGGGNTGLKDSCYGHCQNSICCETLGDSCIQSGDVCPCPNCANIACSSNSRDNIPAIGPSGGKCCRGPGFNGVARKTIATTGAGFAANGFGATWNYGGEVYSAANNGKGVLKVNIDAASYSSGQATVQRVGGSTATSNNDGANCASAASPWPTCGHKSGQGSTEVTDADCGAGFVANGAALHEACALALAATACDLNTPNVGDHALCCTSDAGPFCDPGLGGGCSAGTHLVDNAVTTPCSSGGCTAAACCVKNPYCSSLVGGCATAGTHFRDGFETVECSSGTCTELECCVANDYCSGFTCPSGYQLLTTATSSQCTTHPCTSGQCCGITTSCSASNFQQSSCASGMILKTPLPTTDCTAPCASSECCVVASTCGDIDGDGVGTDFVCAAGSTLKSSPEAINCAATPCATNAIPAQQAACCDQATCGDIDASGGGGNVFVCAAGSSIKSSPAPSSINCGATPCATNTDPTQQAACCDTLPPCDVCSLGGRPDELTFLFVVGAEVAVSNEQDGKAFAFGDKVTGAGPFTLKCFKSKSESTTVGISTSVADGDRYTIVSGGKFPAETACIIAWTGGDEIAREQRLEIHTSCSKQLKAGDQFGSLTLVGYNVNGVDVDSTACSINDEDPCEIDDDEEASSSCTACASGSHRSLGELAFELQVGSVLSNEQEQKASVNGDAVAGAGPFTVECFNHKSPGDTFGAQVLNVGNIYTFTLQSRLTEMECTVKWSDDGEAKQQDIEIHTSCSKLLAIGDAFGGLVLRGYGDGTRDMITAETCDPTAVVFTGGKGGEVKGGARCKSKGGKGKNKGGKGNNEGGKEGKEKKVKESKAPKKAKEGAPFFGRLAQKSHTQLTNSALVVAAVAMMAVAIGTALFQKPTPTVMSTEGAKAPLLDVPTDLEAARIGEAEPLLA